MTTEFDTKDEAMEAACAYLSIDIKSLNGVIPGIDEMCNPLDFNHEFAKKIERYDVKNKDGKDVSFAIGNFRDGYDVWLISETGMSIRV
jgi:hypothetical protein